MDESEITEIRPQVSITDRRTGRDRHRIKAAGFGAILCLDRGNFDFGIDPDDSPIIAWLQAIELSRPTRESFEGAVAALKTLVERHGKVVVHCHHGTVRSVAVVAAYLVDVEGLPPGKAIAEVADRRGGQGDLGSGLRQMVELRP